jgi:PAP2 superfamily
MRPALLCRLAVLVAVAALAIPATAAANEVTNWNAIAQSTVLAQPPNTSAPPASAVFMAMVQGAVYGAVNAIDRHHRPYLVYGRADRHASKDAAVATAAFGVLDATFPAQHATLQAQYDASLAAIHDGRSKEAGIEVGTEAAGAMLAQGHDGRAGPIPPLPPVGPGYWQPLLGANGLPLLDPSPWVANARPFLVRSSSQFRTRGPNPLGSAAYARDVNEVEVLGALNSPTRTAAETHAAVFWQSNPAGMFNSLARRLVDEHQLDVTASALLLGMMDLTAADALINCWNDKYYWGFWRPMAAIQGAEGDGNPATSADPSWQPLFVPTLDPAIGGVGPPLITPPFPDHPSGHLCYTTSSFDALRAFFGSDEMTFFVTSSRFPGEQRYFSRLSDVIRELIEARIWAGIHFRTADEQGMNLGRHVARWTRLHYFIPLH